jgi:hypothetical protein
MTADFQACAKSVQQLSRAVAALDFQCQTTTLPPLVGREWYELLTRKLVPQLSDQSFLVVAVVGGTNIGKSVVFNHLAGFRASATSPLASGTKHPTCLIPRGFRDSHDLRQIFPGFQLRDWESPEEPLREHDDNWLFIRECDETPANLLILDTPDVDSDARINWQRAEHIRRCADVLVTVLTQQKYNDAAVKEFFRQAALEEKSILLVFNQCLLPEDEPYWPLWVGTFCSETGIKPQILYVAPNDRRAAESLQLPFFERQSPFESLAGQAIDPTSPRNLMNDLTALRFGEIKLKTLSGSLHRLIDRDQGVPHWLEEIRGLSAQYHRATELLAANKLAEVADWPTIPSVLLVQEIREWWGQQRQGWSARVHDSYHFLSHAILTPLRMARNKIQGEPVDPRETYRKREWSAVLESIEKVYEKLEWLAELGNDLLKPRLTELLSGVSRAELIRTVREAHNTCDLENELRGLVQSEMATFAQESPQYYKLFRQLDSLAAAARPAVSVIMAVTGVGLVGDVIFTSAATSTLGHLTADVVGGTVAASVGESVIHEGVSQGTGLLQSHLRNLHQQFAARRATWLAELLKNHLLGTLPEELLAASRLSTGPEFLATLSEVEDVHRMVKKLKVETRDPTASE